MKSSRLTISLSFLLLPTVALAVGILDGWGVPVSRDHGNRLRQEVRDVHSLLSTMQSNQDVEIPFRGAGSGARMPKGDIDIEQAFKRIKGTKSSGTDKSAKAQKCRKDKKNKDDNDDGCDEDLAAQAEAPLSSTVSVTPGDSIKIDVSTPAEVDSPAASPVWTYSPAWTPTWPIWSPTNPSSPVVLTRFGEDSTEAPAVAPIEDPISVVPVVTTDVPVIPQVVTNAPATYAPATSAPIVHSNFHFPGKMVHHDEVWVAPGTVAPLTADPIIDVDTLDTRGGELIDAAEELHASLVEEVTPEGSFVSKLQIETDTLVINFGGPGLDLTAVEAIMYEKLVTLLTIFYAAEIGPIFESFDLSLNFSEEIINEATGEVIVTDTSEATTVVIGSVEVGTIINLATASSINLLGIDEAYATNILRSFFDGEYLQKLLNELDGVNMGLSFMELETSDSYVEAIATHNVGETSTETASTALIAGALAGVLVFVTGAALATRRWKSNDDDDLSQLFEEEDQLYPLSNQQDGAASTIGFPTAEDIEEEDSMGSDSFLDWAQPDRPRSSRITSGRIRDDMDGDLFPVDL